MGGTTTAGELRLVVLIAQPTLVDGGALTPILSARLVTAPLPWPYDCGGTPIDGGCCPDPMPSVPSPAQGNVGTIEITTLGGGDTSVRLPDAGDESPLPGSWFPLSSLSLHGSGGSLGEWTLSVQAPSQFETLYLETNLGAERWGAKVFAQATTVGLQLAVSDGVSNLGELSCAAATLSSEATVSSFDIPTAWFPGVALGDTASWMLYATTSAVSGPVEVRVLTTEPLDYVLTQ
jgi:hypothetical protein